MLDDDDNSLLHITVRKKTCKRSQVRRLSVPGYLTPEPRTSEPVNGYNIIAKAALFGEAVLRAGLLFPAECLLKMFRNEISRDMSPERHFHATSVGPNQQRETFPTPVCWPAVDLK